MKPSPSYTGPILTSLAALFAASGACMYAVNIQKIFGGMHVGRERERVSSFACVFFTLFIRRYQDPFFVLKLSLLLTTSFSFKRFIHDVNNNDLFAGSTPSTITNTEWLAATQALVSKWGGKRRSTWETNSTESDEKKHLSLNKLELRKCSREKERRKERKRKKEEQY